PGRLWTSRPRNSLRRYREAALFNLETGRRLAEAVLWRNHFLMQPQNCLNDRYHPRRPTCMADQRLIRGYANRASRSDHLSQRGEFSKVPGRCPRSMSDDPVDLLKFHTG